jgi:hypothetical protein
VLAIGPIIAAVAALAAFAVPNAAQASGDEINIITAGSTSSSVGLLTVVANSTTPINSLTAHLINSTGQDVLDVSDFTFPAQQSGNTKFVVSSPITQAQLALGSYKIYVDATDSGGASVTGVRAGGLDYLIVPTIKAKADRQIVNYANQTVTFTGTAKGRWPDGSTAPLPDLPVTVGSVTVRTAADGTFTASVTQPDPGTYWVSSGLTATTAESAPAGPFAIIPQPVRVKITAKLSSKKINYGQPVTVTGTVSYRSGSSWAPLPGGTVDINGALSPLPAPVKSTVTAANGTFQVTVPTLRLLHGPITVYAGATVPGNPFLDKVLLLGQVNLPLTVVQPLRINSYNAWLSRLGVLTITACVTDLNRHGPDGVGAKVEYAQSATGPWTTFKSYQYALSGPCAATPGKRDRGSQLDLKIGAKLASAYYRVYLPASPSYQAATSKAVRAWLYETKITSISVSPNTVPAGSKLTVSGRLWRALTDTAKTWQQYGGRQVLIIYHLKGKKTWYQAGTATTSATGWFHRKLYAYGKGTLIISALYLGDKEHLWSHGGTATLTITGSSSAVSQLSGSGAGQPVIVRQNAAAMTR